MVWVKFLLSAVIISISAIQLSKYADYIAVRTRLGGMFVGTLLLAGATSLPEILTMLSAIRNGEPGLAAGNLMGSNMVNMLIMAILDLQHNNRSLLHEAAANHALTGSLSVMMIALPVFFIMANIPLGFSIGQTTLGLDSLSLILAFIIAMNLLQRQSRAQARLASDEEPPAGFPSLTSALVGFFVTTVVLVIVSPWLVSSSIEIADITGLGTTFIGTTLVAIVTSIPELLSTISASRMGADDLAIGNLFGSNMFNMALLGVADLFYSDGRFFATVDPSFITVGMLGLIMTLMALIGTLARVERKKAFMQIDSLLIIVVYIAGMTLLYSRGITIIN